MSDPITEEALDSLNNHLRITDEYIDDLTAQLISVLFDICGNKFPDLDFEVGSEAISRTLSIIFDNDDIDDSNGDVDNIDDNVDNINGNGDDDVDDIDDDVDDIDDGDDVDSDEYDINRNPKHQREKAIMEVIVERLVSKSSAVYRPHSRHDQRPEVKQVIERVSRDGSFDALYDATTIIGDNINDIDDCIRAVQRYISITHVNNEGKRISGKFIKKRYPSSSVLFGKVRSMISEGIFGPASVVRSRLSRLNWGEKRNWEEINRKLLLWKDRVEESDHNSIYFVEEYDITSNGIAELNYSCTEMYPHYNHSRKYIEFNRICWEVKPTSTEMAFCRETTFFKTRRDGHQNSWFMLKDCYHIYETENEFKESKSTV